MQFPWFILGGFVLAVSCSKVKELDKRTQSMERSTEKVSESTDVVKTIMSNMYLQQRAGQSLETRNKSYAKLIDQNSNFEIKFNAANEYVQSFEFQLYTGDVRYENEKLKESLHFVAIEEFAGSVSDLYYKITPSKMSPLKQSKGDSDALAFYALSGALHSKSHLLEEAGVSNSSLYELITTALRKEKENQDLLKYEETLTSTHIREIMIELLKARVDMLAMMSLNNMTKMREMTLSQRSSALLHSLSNGKMGEVSFTKVDNLTSSTKNRIEHFLTLAVETKAFLKSLGLEKKLDRNLLSAYKNLKLDAPQNKSIDGKSNDIKSLINRLME